MSYRVAVLISGSGSNLQALLDAERAGELGAQVVLVASDRPTAQGLQRGLQHGLATACVPLAAERRADGSLDRATWERRLADVVAAFAPDLIVLAGFMRVLSAEFLARFPDRVINQHPALLPRGGGSTVLSSSGIELPALRGAHVVAEALARALPLTGCTIHRVTALVDDGPVLAQAEVPILADDSVESLHERIKAREQGLIVEVVRRLARAHR
jgi:phosphoribosylglycinamide formyltransferase 1